MNEVETHTIGPWEVTDQNGDPEGSFRGVRGPTRTNSLGKSYNTYVAQYCFLADARLIAAAPMMLGALQSLPDPQAFGGWEAWGEAMVVWKRNHLIPAIAKATGVP